MAGGYLTIPVCVSHLAISPPAVHLNLRCLSPGGQASVS